MLSDSILICPSNTAQFQTYISSNGSTTSAVNNILYNGMSYAYPSGFANDSRRSLGGRATSGIVPPVKLTQIQSTSETMNLIEASQSSELGLACLPLGGNTPASLRFGMHGGNRLGTNLLFCDGHALYFANGAELLLQWNNSATQVNYPFNTDLK